jgi:polyhydroxybutyrate depolymerase
MNAHATHRTAAVLLLAAASIGNAQSQTTAATLNVSALQRDYLVHVPAGLPDAPVPLVFVFHGGGGESRSMAGLTRFSAVADREKFVVVYPQGIGRGWNDGRVSNVSQAHREQIDDLAFFDAMLDALSREHRIDPRRVFATGISNGGMFSHYLGANRASKVAAIAPVVGGITEPFDQRFKPAEPVSVLIIQGTADSLVPYGGGRVAASSTADRGSVVSTDRAVQMWTSANACSGEPQVQPLPDRDPNDGTRIEAKTWSACRNGSAVWLYRVDGGGHTWPSGPMYAPRALIGRVTNDIDSLAIWDFFRAHPKGTQGR